MRITIAHVAQRAGVGAATVSRVLNNSAAVSPRTRVRVLQAVDELGYEPNEAARALSTGQTRTLGVLAPFLTEPSVMERLRGVSREVTGAGYQLVLFDVEHPEQASELTTAGRLDGLLCVSLCPSDADLERFGAAGLAVVLVDAEHHRLSGISIDDVGGGRLAARHLLALGHRRIAFVGDEDERRFNFTSSARRGSGAAAACLEVGADLLVRRGAHGRDPARKLAAALLAAEAPPTAIFAASDTQALGVLQAAEDAGFDVPEDLSVVGFDDIEVARYAGLTTVGQPLEESGVAGIRLLLEALKGAPRRTQQADLRLVVRATTAPPSHAARAARIAGPVQEGIVNRR